MALSVAGAVVLAYSAGVVGVHRGIVAHRRRQAGGYETLRWLDWDTLLTGITAANDEQRALLEALRAGTAVPPHRFEQLDFGEHTEWLTMLASLRATPEQVRDVLERDPADTVAAFYLREWLTLEHDVTVFNLELQSFGAKLRINRALRRFGEHPALYFVRARASSLLGFNAQVVDDLARAVYFSRQAPFYVRAVTQLPFIEELRPALMRACREAQDRGQAPVNQSS